MSHQVTRNTDSNSVPMEGRKNGSLTIRSRIWLGNISPISRDKSSQNKILGKVYVSGMLFTSVSGMLFTGRNYLENVLKSDRRSPFRK